MGEASPRSGAWDRSMMLTSPSASNTTPSARFAGEETAGLKVRAWVEEVIGRRLPDGDFAAGFKDGVGLCELVNCFKPGAVSKIETSPSPFHQMANISCFLKAVRVLGVREQVLFETLDLYNENHLSQVIRCLFSLSELVRTTMPEYTGPYLAAQEKPQADPAVLHLVDIAKGHVMPAQAPGWGGGGPVTPGAVSMASSGRAANNSGGAAASAAGQLSLPPRIEQEGVASNGCCLSPAAHAAGRLTYGIYEGGGEAATTKQPALSPVVTRGKNGAAAAATEVLKAQLRAEEQGRAGTDAAGGGGTAGGEDITVAVDYAESALPVVNTPRVALPTPREPMNSSWRTTSMATSMAATPTRGGDGSEGFAPRTLEEHARRRREATAQSDAEMEVALWIEGVTGETFPGKFWTSLKDGVLLCKLMNSIQPGLIKPGLPHTSRGTFPELENLSAFLSACQKMGLAKHSVFNKRDLHEKKDMAAVVRCLHALGEAIPSAVPEFNGPFLGKRSEALSVVNARGLRKRLGKGPGARGGINTLTANKGAGGATGEHPSPGGDNLPIEQHPDPTATMTPAESATRTSRRREASDSAAGSGQRKVPVSPRAMAEGLCGALQPAVILEEESGNGAAPAVVRVERDGRRGPARALEETTGEQRNLAGLFASAATAPGEERGRGEGERVAAASPALRRGFSGASGMSRTQPRSRATTQHEQEQEEDRGEGAVSQIQRFVEKHTHQPWRISGDLHESLRDGWQLALLANALRPGAVRRVHNSIQPAKQVQNIANFLIACRRMGVARALLFDIEDLYEKKSNTRVLRTLLALRALAADPDFARARPSSLMGAYITLATGAPPPIPATAV